MATVILVSGDLMFAGPIKAAAQSAGLQFRLAGRLEGQPTEGVKGVIVDLAFAKMEPAEVAAWAAELDPRPRVIGFGPHVDSALLENARSAGFDAVITRGQMHREAGNLMQRVATGA